ncbi:uncharacterized protein LOC127250051 isoform X2 [Andrographis paniculata]|uniref:uncharacterized protein LOC127250051 isoform X2 n=1 Tax=Andrographis paniculata TaxID=175694 RepID=UPI0021E9380D|nr:uncharacterized protein LOC127250051 isoform X2 [Andrographis paniculata]
MPTPPLFLPSIFFAPNPIPNSQFPNHIIALVPSLSNRFPPQPPRPRIWNWNLLPARHTGRNADASKVMPDKGCGDEFPHNISVQTGEEFSPEFLRDRMVSRRTLLANEVDQIPTSKPSSNVPRNHHPVCNDQAGALGLRRVDSESSTVCSDLCSRKGYGFDLGYDNCIHGSNRYYRGLQGNAQHHRNFSGDSGVSVNSFESPNFYQVYNKALGVLDGSFTGKIKFLCSFGGKILPRPNDGKLRYVGGETRIISIRKDLSYPDLVNKTTAICRYPHTIKYQLPLEDLDALISVSSSEDLHHMIEEYHELDRSSQRLRIFLIPSGDLEVPGSSEARAMLQNDPEYQYVVAVNGMMDSNVHKSSSRESMENFGGGNLDVFPAVHKGSLTSFHCIENQNGGSNLNFMPPTLHAQVFCSPQVPTSSPIVSPSITPVQFTDPNVSNMEDCGGVAWQKVNSPYLIGAKTYESPGCADALSYSRNNPNDSVPVVVCSNANSQPVQSYGTPTVSSSFLLPSKNFESPLPGPSYFNATRGFPTAVLLHAEKLASSKNAIGFSPVSNTHCKSCRRRTNLFHESKTTNEEKPSVSLEQGSEKISQVSKDEIELSHEAPGLNNDYDCDKDMTISMQNAACTSDGTAKAYAYNSDYASKVHDLERKQNLPSIMCQPVSKLPPHVQTLKQQISGLENSPSMFNSAENPEENMKEPPRELEFLIKSQKGIGDNDQSQVARKVPFLNDEFVSCLDSRQPNVLADAAPSQKETTNGSYESVAKDSNGNTNKDNPDGDFHKELVIEKAIHINSQHLRNCHETHSTEMPNEVEDAKAVQTTDGQSSSKAIPNPQLEHNDMVESPGTETEAESVVSESDCNDANIVGDNKDEPLSDAATIEMEATMHGLQIIRNADLEDLQELGSGTYGTVYHGKWRGTDVAIKRIKKSCFCGKASEQEQLIKDFLREAKILSKLHHPNVVAFYGVVPDGPGVSLATVTEYMANGSLRYVLQRKDRVLDRRKRIMIALGAAFGMEYLHLKNIVHFDLKCDNLLVNLGDPHRPVCKVGDFGLSRIKQNTLVSGGVRGTLPWMAPELLSGSSNRVSEKVDVFSFGMTIWEMLTGEEPYANMHCGAIIGRWDREQHAPARDPGEMRAGVEEADGGVLVA